MIRQQFYTYGVGNTRLVEHKGIYFKCEFENPTGSVKDRGISVQISKLLEMGVRSAVISSSGNAAISAAKYCREANIKLTVFISPKLKASKKSVLEKLDCTLIVSPKPISSAFRCAQKTGAYNLRQSKDENAVAGYEALGLELIRQNQEIDAVFIPASSCTTFVGVYRGFQKGKKKPAFHAVQTEAIHPVASQFDKSFTSRKESIADAIVARITSRADEAVKIIKQSGGYGWVVSDKEISGAWEELAKFKLTCSYEGAMSLSAYQKAIKNGYRYKTPVCILTGKYYE
ncbi:hypothetical protein A2960_03785 [Candidatus Gottesmanbacteria bacterium RIFCSPLOWO2_01_FULL_39_12b]|uniref:Tryptophan synthase beta chain-like PALP domain-containing protein n=1 Tax=Candidatus Gottesmanbacteria bacterium RIFCSPLOWO2_01_FULL_39_12b TaxID=1798388 RepID=A0A1F6AQN6_9BACT|nr:MAG: hypothetical protein A2960_03785 [Candidatus Gottesmanbacteria bacterium RIFCSPLOWO2_01_FULL_39_12b]